MTASTIAIGSERDHRPRPNFRQRRIVAFTASLRYAKITPSELHGGDLAGAWPNRLTQDLNPELPMIDVGRRPAGPGRRLAT
jgi:hypothetical protein